MANALPLLLAGGAALLLLGGKKKAVSAEGEESPEWMGQPDVAYCEGQGGDWELIEGKGFCVFPDGKKVNSFAFFRGEAEPE